MESVPCPSPDSAIPLGLCGCGCGRATTLIRKTSSGQGRIKGQPNRFLPGHQFDHSPRPETVAETEARFWSHVQHTEGEGCWLWQAGQRGSGYGVFTVAARPRAAHRFSYELAYGPIPHGDDVLHRCGTPRCVRPDHLYLGDDRANAADREAMGRTARGDRNGMRLHPERVLRGANHPKRQGRGVMRGEEHPMAKLTWQDVRAIRALYQQTPGAGYAWLARRYGITAIQVKRIVRHLSWME